jgi:hypothetical protein
MMLIDDWKQAYRLFSVQVAAALVALEVAGGYLPELKEYLGDDFGKWIGLAIIIARIIRQTPAHVGADPRGGGNPGDAGNTPVARGEE